MPRHIAIALVIALAAPGAVQAQEHILESAERLATETTLQGGPEFRRSPIRTTIGIAMAAAGVAMMLIEPSQPTEVARDTLTREAGQQLASDTFLDSIFDLAVENGNIGHCALRPTCAAYAAGTKDGGTVGAGMAFAIATDGTRTIYSDQISTPNAGLRYGGAALAVAGAAVAALWSSVPVMRDVSVSPLHGGVAVGSKIGF